MRDGLRVIEASVIPVVASTNTNAPTIMIAEKAAEKVGRRHTASPWIYWSTYLLT